MCNREAVQELIYDYVEELRSHNYGNCMTPEKRHGNYCSKHDCDECRNRYFSKLQKKLERRCGVL